MENACEKLSFSPIDVYFLECCYERAQRRLAEAKVFFIGPYQSIDDAARRTKTIRSSVRSPLESIHIRSMRAEALHNSRYLIEGTRVFNTSSLVLVNNDGTVAADTREFHLPSDYFDTAIDYV